MPATKLKLYHSFGSPNCRRTRVFLAEKGVEVELVAVDLGNGEVFTDAYKQINPRSQIPALVIDDGTAIAEVPAVMTYVEAAFAEKPLLGTTALQKAEIAMWDRRMEIDGFNPVMEAVRNSMASLVGRALSGPHKYSQIPQLADRSKLRVANFYKDLEARLGASTFVAGTEFSVADITAVVTIDFATKALQLPIPEDHVAIKTWYETVSKRPSMAA